MIRRVRAVLATALVAATVAGGVAAAGPARAQTAATGATVTLASQDAWVRSGTNLRLTLGIAGAPPGAVVSFALHDRVISRSAFDATLAANPALGTPRNLFRIPVDALPIDASGNRVAVVPGSWMPSGGVYPLEVDLWSASDQHLAGFVTHAVALDLGVDGKPIVGVPLAFAWVWPLATTPAYLPDGTADPTVVGELSASGRLGRQAALLGGSDVPVTLAAAGETFDAWATLAEKNAALAPGMAAVRAAAGHDEVLGGPFVPLDLPSILAAGLGGVIPGEQSRGISAAEGAFGVHIDPSIAAPGPLDAASVRVLQDANVRELVVDGGALTPTNGQFTAARPAQLADTATEGTGGVSVVGTDTGLQRFLTGDDAPALRAEHLLAELTIVAGEQPSLTRGVAIANPADWDPDPAFVDAVFAGLRGNPVLRATTVADLFSSVPAATGNGANGGDPAVRQLAPVTTSPPPIPLSVYQEGQRQAAALRALVSPADPRAAAGDRALASSLTRMWQNTAGRRRAYGLLLGISHTSQQILDQIQVPAQSTITITSSRAEIPVTMRNRAAQALTVHVKLSSDRLLFPDGAERDVRLEPGRSTTARFTVETRSSGSAPVTMTVTAAGGALTVASGVRITVKSSFVSGVGLVLTIGAAVFLMLWWGWDIRRRRGRRAPRERRARTLPAGRPAGSPA